jgi:hypothetical protein
MERSLTCVAAGEYESLTIIERSQSRYETQRGTAPLA